MPSYKAPIRDFKFALNEFLEIQNYSNEIEGLKDLSIIDPILEEGARFAEEILFPLNAVGDKQGLRFENNQVFLPDGFVEAYKTYVASGWASFACTKEYGGQDGTNLAMAVIREHLAAKGLGLHNDLQNEHSIVGNNPFILMFKEFATNAQYEFPSVTLHAFYTNAHKCTQMHTNAHKCIEMHTHAACA
jgi:hypothetical protein